MSKVGFVNYHQVNAQAIAHYQKYHEKANFKTCVRCLYDHGAYTTDRPALPSHTDWSLYSDEEFYDLLDQLPVGTNLPDNSSPFDLVMAEYIMPEAMAAYAIKYVRDILEHRHTHDFFEIPCVLSGKCLIQFENETWDLSEGQICIIAPNSSHDVIVEDESIVISLMLRQSTFETTFFKLLTQKDLLASFLRTILYSAKTTANYLLFTTDNPPQIRNAIKDIFMECYITDPYSNTCLTSRIHLFFSLLLRKYSHTIQSYEPQRANYYQASFAQILQHIQTHYQSVSLKSLSETFHYNPSYISRLIRMNTGHTLTELLASLKLSHARDLLLYSQLKIKEISALSGYSNTDHFSRQFKKAYGDSPADYRHKHQNL